MFEAQSSENTTVFFFWLKKILPTSNFLLLRSMSAFPSSILVPQFDFECTFLRHISTDAISDCLEWKLRLSSFRGTGTQGTKQPYTKKLGQNFGAGISSQELCQDDILMTSSYRQNCLWPELTQLAETSLV